MALNPLMRLGAAPSGPFFGVSREREASLSTASMIAREEEVARLGRFVMFAGREVGMRRSG